MPLSSWAYGSVAGVAALRPNWATGAGTFDGTTNPTLTTVETWIDQISSMINSKIGTMGFVTPISSVEYPQITSQLDLFVNLEVADILDSMRGAGRIGSQLTARGFTGSLYGIISADVSTYLSGVAEGWEQTGLAKDRTLGDKIFTRDTDDNGAEIFPVFQRDMFDPLNDWHKGAERHDRYD